MWIDTFWINPEVKTVNFACDLARCKGACCTFYGGSGAPIDADEIPSLLDVFPVVKKYLSADHLRVIERDGMFQPDGESTAIRCVNERACVFVMFDGGVARCAIQYAYLRGEIGLIKPRSCHLFPIRIHSSGGTRIEYERFGECAPALDNGDRTGTRLIEFLEEPLTRVFGAAWFARLREWNCDADRFGAARKEN